MNVHLTMQVPRSPDLNHTVDRFQRKLEPLLFVFQPELVQLQGRLLRHSSREGVRCRLNLHLPTGQLSSEEGAATAQAAFRAASDDLIRQLQKHKQRLRETRMRPAGGRIRPRPVVEAGSGAGNANLGAYFGAQYGHILAFIRRQIQLRERLGELPAGRLEPEEVMDEVVLAALQAMPDAAALNRGRWLLLLAAAAIRKLTKANSSRQHGIELRSLDQDAQSADGASSDDNGEGDEALELQDFVRSPHADPEQTALAAEAMDRLAAALARIPRELRHDLVLYMLEGFRPQELAQVSGRNEAEVRAALEQAQQALRQQSAPQPVLARFGSRSGRRLKLQPQQG